MALFRGIGARKEPDPGRGTAAIEVRKDLAGLFVPALGRVGALAGLMPVSSAVVVGTSGWQYQVLGFHAVATRGESDGAQLFGNDGPVLVGTSGIGGLVPTAPGAGNSRIDIIWVRHPSASENADTSSEPIFGVASGVSASVPVAPSIPTGAVELARNTMTSAATSTASSGNTIAPSFQRTALRGTAVVVPDQAGRDALLTRVLTPSVFGPLQVFRADLGAYEYTYNGTDWLRQPTSLPWTAYSPTWTGSTTNPSVGNGLVVGRWSQVATTVTFAIQLTVGTSGASGGSGAWGITLPKPAAATNMRFYVGGQLQNGATRRTLAATILPSATGLSDLIDSAGANLIAGYALAANAVMTFTGTYEVA